MRTLLILLLAASAAAAQDAPRPNRVAWFEILPDPLPDGRSGVTLEATSQFLRPDKAGSPDGRSRAELDAEEWQLTFDGARDLGPGRLSLRLRVVNRSGGIADQAFTSWHTALGTVQGGRELAPKFRHIYSLERDGRVVARLDEPATQLLDADLAWIRTTGSQKAGARWGLSLQLPIGRQSNWSGSGGTDLLLGAAAWKAFGHWRLHGQAEQAWIGLPRNSPLRAALALNHQARAWAGLGWQGEGAGFWRGLGLDVTLAWAESPYRTGIGRIDRSGWQQHWTLTHRAIPGWFFTVSEEAGTYTAPDLTAALGKRF